MFLNKVFKFLSGYVILSLKGISIERFINICVRRGIKLLSISKHERDSAVVTVYMCDFHRLRAPAFKTRTAVHIEQKCGLPVFMKKYARRYALAAGAAFVAAVFAVGSQFVWIVDTEGAETVNKERLSAAVRLTGLRPGILKSRLPSGGEMKTVIMSNTDDISWAWVYIRGARAIVSVRAKGIQPDVIDKSVPCDIVAMCDGVVSSVTAKSGIAAVHKGAAVSAGDVLIAGTIDNGESLRTVHASGDVRASVFKTVSGEYPLYEEIRTPNGNNKMLFTLTLFSKNIKFFKNSSISQAEYDTIENSRYIDTPLGRFGVCTVHANGVDASERILSPEEAEAAALYELEEKISKTLTAGAVLVNKNVRREIIGGRTVRVTLEAEFEQNIGLEKEIVVR